MPGSVSNNPSRPLVLGHRGARPRGLRRLFSSAPTENSLAAFEYTLSRGCDGFEFDVRHTRDGRNVLWHDPEFNGREIAVTNYAELTARGATRLPCLEDVLGQFAARAYLDLELKVAGREERIVAAIQQTPPQCGYIVSSFLPDTLLRIHDLDDKIPLGYICERPNLMDLWRELPIKVFLPRHDLAQPKMIDEVHKNRQKLMTWTVNSPRRMRRLAAWGVDGLISDNPHLLFRTVGACASSE